MTGHLSPGTILHQRYSIIGLIGSGGMGAVYLADDNRLEGRRCAIKETQFSLSLTERTTQAMRDQFHREASILSRLDHPNLPKVSDYFSEGDRDYLVMDYVSGPDLHQVVADAPKEDRFLDEATVLAWTTQLCDALTYLHTRNPPVLHRDVKPANVKLTPEGRVKLVDFGLVKPLDPDNPDTITSLHGVGSLPYTPLEQYVDEIGHTDPRSDLYSLGATLYRLLTGVEPPSAQARFLNPDILIPPGRINSEISSSVEAAILSAMALHPKDRPASVKDWCSSLAGLDVTAPVPLSLEVDGGWRVALRENLVLIVLALVTIVLSLAVTAGLLGPS